MVSTLRRRLVAVVETLLRRAAESRWGRPAWERLKRSIDGEQFADLDRRLTFYWERTPPDEWAMLTKAWDDTTPLPPGAERELRDDNPRLQALRERYADSAPERAGLWKPDELAQDLDLRWFRGDSPYVWQYRDLPRATRLKFYVFARHVQERDHAGLLDRLVEDGAFGCWTYRYPGLPPVSRDLLDSVNELLFLDRHLGLLSRRDLRVLDIGAGYGRLAWRTSEAVEGLADYCCVDAVAESTFLCEYHLHHRGVVPPARVVPFDEVGSALRDARFDLAVNVHGFSETTYASIADWCGHLTRLQVPHLFVVPNEGERFLSLEPDGTRRDFRPLIEQAGYRLVRSEPVIDDDAVRELVRVFDHFCLFELQPRS